MQATAKDVLLQVNRLLGEPSGAYYDMMYRLSILNQAQVEMVQDTLGDVSEVEIPLDGDDTYLPDDFLTFGKQAPYFRTNAGDVSLVEVKDVTWMDRSVPGWQSVTHGPTSYVVVDGSRRLRLYPSGATGSLVVPYVRAPEPVWSEDDLIFNGDPQLARFSTALAYKIAASEIMGVAPQQGVNFLEQYNREMRRMRESRRTSPQVQQVARAKGFYRRGRGY